MTSPVLQVNLSAGYGKTGVLRDVRFELEAGEALGLVGTSGAGKSTLVMALMGLLPWRGGTVSGAVLLRGRDLLRMSVAEARRTRGREIALIPQSPMTALNPAVSLGTHFEQAWRAHEPASRHALRARIEQLAEQVKLPCSEDFLRRRPGQISVGQAQRILIALALLHRPAVIVADEPTSALDPITQSEIVKLLGDLNREMGTALLYVSHDLVSVLQLCRRLAVLDGGTVAECLPMEEVELARHPATRALLCALPVPPAVLLAYRNDPERTLAAPRAEASADSTSDTWHTTSVG